MRKKDILLGFNDLKILLQYLYLDQTNVVVIRNCIDVPLRLRMNDRGIVLCKNLNFSDSEETNWTENVVTNINAIVDYLESMPAVEFPKRFKSRWEEIKTLSQIQMSLN